MKEELFQELLESIKQSSKIMRGEMKPGLSFHIEQPDVKFTREKYGLSKDKFAKLLGISTFTLRNWKK